MKPTAARVRVISCAAAAFSLACTETPYAFFAGSGSCSGTGCECGTAPCVDSGGAASGGRPTDAARMETGSRDSGRASDAAPLGQAGERCESPRDQTVTLERLQVASSGRCVSQGAYEPLRGDPSYRTELATCEETLAQMWAIRMLDGGGLEFRNAAVDLNLDVRFAEIGDGTPLVLYNPHQFFNQRFDLHDDDGSTFKLSPLHAPSQCVTEQDPMLVLLPCEAGRTDQTFRRIACR